MEAILENGLNDSITHYINACKQKMIIMRRGFGEKIFICSISSNVDAINSRVR